MSRLIKAAFTSAALTGALALPATAAGAVPSTQSGTQTTAQHFAGESAPWTAQTTGAWGNIPTASINVTVPAGTTRFVNARFTAESLCVGPANTWCTARVVVVNSAGTTTELNPVVGTDYKFDTPGGDEQAHALERFSGPLGPGTYTVRVQGLRIAGITQFVLDDYAFAVNLVQP
ncbi:hypothetical protein ACIBEJ_19930 [Nonomuraea sp. NPDC050790]|uniref:hypothetical protein n=1 Tax=Nonomuraea sp. NPDC050790 TaxID=3364371 RepID=UPI003796A807